MRVGDMVVGCDSGELVAVLGLVALVRFIGDNLDGSGCELADESLRGLVLVHCGDAQLESAYDPGQKRHNNDSSDETGRDLHAIGTLDDIGDRGIDQDRRDHPDQQRSSFAIRVLPNTRRSVGSGIDLQVVRCIYAGLRCLDRSAAARLQTACH
ncbi:MAG: hypothetical protein ACRDRG_19345 [Pseudonocardiaceae bacterium]